MSQQVRRWAGMLAIVLAARVQAAPPELCQIRGGNTKVLYGDGLVPGATELWAADVPFDPVSALAALRAGTPVSDASALFERFDVAVAGGAGADVPALARESGLAVNERGQILIDPYMRSVSHPQILEILERHGSIAYAMDTACAYAEAARQSISELTESDFKRALLWVPGFVTSRDR